MATAAAPGDRDSVALQRVPAIRLPFLPTTEAPSPHGVTWARVGSIAVGAATGLTLGMGSLLAGVAVFSGGMFALVVVYSGWTMRAARRHDASLHEFLQALGRGDRARARALVERWLGGGPPMIRMVARHNLAWTELTDGRPAEAIALFAINEGDRKTLQRLAMDAMSAINLALAHALAGELAASHAWVAEADRRMSGSKRTRPTDPGMRTYVRAILDCREGRPADAARDLEQRWSELESTMTGTTLRPVRILRAFAVAAADPRDAGKAERLLVPPNYPGEFDFLAVTWPELGQFLAAHRLGGPADAPPAEVAPSGPPGSS